MTLVSVASVPSPRRSSELASSSTPPAARPPTSQTGMHKIKDTFVGPEKVPSITQGGFPVIVIQDLIFLTRTRPFWQKDRQQSDVVTGCARESRGGGAGDPRGRWSLARRVSDWRATSSPGSRLTLRRRPGSGSRRRASDDGGAASRRASGRGRWKPSGRADRATRARRRGGARRGTTRPSS